MFLAEYLSYRLALLTYWLNIFVLGITLYFSWVCAIDNNLVQDDISAAIRAAIKRRIAIAQSLYALGAALCFISSYLSIAFVVLVQLNYAVAPRLPRRSNS